MSQLLRRRRHRPAFTLIELLVVVLILCGLLALLLPTLSSARKKAALTSLQSQYASDATPQSAAAAQRDGASPTSHPAAHVKSFEADISLTPGLSVGTAEPESIYEVRFDAKMDVKPASDQSAENEVLLPLPPQIISLADLTVTLDGEPSDAVSMRGDRLVWTGRIDPLGPAALSVAYTAVGKGLYVLQTPPGKIIDRFRIALQAHGSDVRMLELSLQPTALAHTAGTMTYTWDYKRLMFGRPIALDVLGIAPLDRLGELRWLGPLSVIMLGLIVGLVANAWQVERFDRWLLLLVLGTFAGSYPLMYFAQEFIPLKWAMMLSGGGVLVIIAVRTITVMGFGKALFGVVVPAAGIMTLALAAAVRPQMQGILLTAMALCVFTIAMVLAPKLHVTRRKEEIVSETPPLPPIEPSLT